MNTKRFSPEDYLEAASILCGSSLQVSNWSGDFPQKPHGVASLFKKGLWLAQVPANLPSFLAQILIAIPATLSNNNAKVINRSFICIV